MDAKGGGHLVDRQQALVAQAATPVFKTVFPAQLPDDEVAEPPGHAWPKTTCVQDLGDLGVGVMLEQTIDLGDDRWIRPPQLIGGLWQREPDGVRGAAAEADLSDHLLRLDQCHVLQKEADHTLPFALRSSR